MHRDNKYPPSSVLLGKLDPGRHPREVVQEQAVERTAALRIRSTEEVAVGLGERRRAHVALDASSQDGVQQPIHLHDERMLQADHSFRQGNPARHHPGPTLGPYPRAGGRCPLWGMLLTARRPRLCPRKERDGRGSWWGARKRQPPAPSLLGLVAGVVLGDEGESGGGIPGRAGGSLMVTLT